MNSPWEAVHERKDGNRTGRWQWLTITDGHRVYYPGVWLLPYQFCPPPGVGVPSTKEKKDGKSNNP